MRISDWSSDVCSSDLVADVGWRGAKWDRDRKYPEKQIADRFPVRRGSLLGIGDREALLWIHGAVDLNQRTHFQGGKSTPQPIKLVRHAGHGGWEDTARAALALSKMNWNNDNLYRSEEHTSELQSLMRNSYAVFCLK